MKLQKSKRCSSCSSSFLFINMRSNFYCKDCFCKIFKRRVCYGFKYLQNEEMFRKKKQNKSKTKNENLYSRNISTGNKKSESAQKDEQSNIISNYIFDYTIPITSNKQIILSFILSELLNTYTLNNINLSINNKKSRIKKIDVKYKKNNHFEDNKMKDTTNLNVILIADTQNDLSAKILDCVFHAKIDNIEKYCRTWYFNQDDDQKYVNDDYITKKTIHLNVLKNVTNKELTFFWYSNYSKFIEFMKIHNLELFQTDEFDEMTNIHLFLDEMNNKNSGTCCNIIETVDKAIDK